MEIIRLTSSESPYFETVVNWNYNWWGKRDGISLREVRCTLMHSLCVDRLPQTFLALVDGVPAGMYQLSMIDDLYSRPDLYPWMIDVFVDPAFRNRGVCAALMQTVHNNAKALGLTELYLYTKHVGLYEKFGWEFLEEIETFRDDSPIERLYRLTIR